MYVVKATALNIYGRETDCILYWLHQQAKWLAGADSKAATCLDVNMSRLNDLNEYSAFNICSTFHKIQVIYFTAILIFLVKNITWNYQHQHTESIK
jgi:hypothetical protein